MDPVAAAAAAQRAKMMQQQHQQQQYQQYQQMLQMQGAAAGAPPGGGGGGAGGGAGGPRGGPGAVLGAPPGHGHAHGHGHHPQHALLHPGMFAGGHLPSPQQQHQILQQLLIQQQLLHQQQQQQQHQHHQHPSQVLQHQQQQYQLHQQHLMAAPISTPPPAAAAAAAAPPQQLQQPSRPVIVKPPRPIDPRAPNDATYSMLYPTNPATGVEHCVVGSILSPLDTNLVLARKNVIEIYRLSTLARGKELDTNKSKRLKLLLRQSMHGNIESIGVVSHRSLATQLLLLSFTHAKASTVRYNPATHSLDLFSMHYFEKEELKYGFTRFHHKPAIQTDPDNRCAAMLVYDRSLAVIPFKVDGTTLDLDDDHSKSDTTKAKPFQPSFIIGAHNNPALGVENIKAYAFLHGYFLPTLLILHEPKQTWAGRLEVCSNTAVVTAINVTSTQWPVIWSIDGLPHDSFGLIPIPPPLGGVLILSPNVIMYTNGSSSKIAFRLNLFAPSGGDFSFPIINASATPPMISLDACHHSFLTLNRLLVSLNNGDLYIFHLEDDGRAVTNINISKAGTSAIASCMCTIGSEYIFLGSRIGDSILIRYQEKTEATPAPATTSSTSSSSMQSDDGGAATKRLKTSGEYADTNTNGNGDDDDDDDIYGDSSPKPRADSAADALPDEDEQQQQQDREQELIGNVGADLGLNTQQDLHEEKEEDALLFYSSVADNRSTEEKSYTFAISDTLVNIGPIGQLESGVRFQSQEESAVNRTRRDLVVLSGHGKNGAISVLHTGIAPEVIVSFPLPGCIGVWSVYDTSSLKRRREQDESEREANGWNDTDAYQALLVLSRKDRTTVLQMGADELKDITQYSQLQTQSATVAVGNLLSNRRVVQVTQSGSFVCIGARSSTEVPLRKGVTALYADVLDPYVVALLDNHTVALLQPQATEPSDSDDQEGSEFYWQYLSLELQPKSLDELQQEEEENEARAANGSRSPQQDGNDAASNDQAEGDKKDLKSTALLPRSITACCLYKDELERLPLVDRTSTASSSDSTTEDRKDDRRKPSGSASDDEDDDEDESFYDDADAFVSTSISDTAATSTEEPEASPSARSSAHYLAITRANGSLEIFRLPSYEPVFTCADFARVPDILHSDSERRTPAFLVPHIALPPSGNNNLSSILVADPVIELCIKLLGSNDSLPVLMARTASNDLLVYQAYHVERTLRWFRVKHGIITRTLAADGTAIEQPQRSQAPEQRVRKFSEFFDGQRHGVCMVGPRPVWILCERDYVHVVHFEVGEKQPTVAAFCHLHNSAVSNGYVYAAANGTINICKKSEYTSIEGVWPVKKVSLRRTGKILTPYFVSYHPEARIYVLAVSYNKRITNLPDTETGGLARYQKQFELRLVSPAYKWETVDTYELEEFEHVLSAEVVFLRVLVDGKRTNRPFLVVGTSYQVGEDIACKGRLIIFEVITPVSIGGEVTKPHFKFIQAKVEKGPVSAVTAVQGLIVLAIGPKVLMYNFETLDELEGYAFYDAQIYCVSIKVIKNYIIVADVYKSVCFLMWREAQRQLSLLGKDYGKVDVQSLGFLTCGRSLRIAVADNSENVQLYEYAPQRTDTDNGMRLMPVAEMHYGHVINSLLRVKMRGAREKLQHACIYGSLDGAVGAIVPVAESAFKLLLQLQTRLEYLMPHCAGLNPRAYRNFAPRYISRRPKCKQILDGELLQQFLWLSRDQQDHLASLIGTTTNVIISSLAYTQSMVLVF